MPPHDDSAGRLPALVAEHESAVRRYFRRAVGSPSLADDLTQDVFLRVVKAEAAFEPRGRDRAWLFTIAHNVLGSTSAVRAGAAMRRCPCPACRRRLSK